MRRAIPIVLTNEERATLTNWARSRTAPARVVTRARVVLAAADGAENQQIAAAFGVAEGTVRTWRRRFADERLPGTFRHRAAGWAQGKQCGHTAGDRSVCGLQRVSRGSPAPRRYSLSAAGWAS